MAPVAVFQTGQTHPLVVLALVVVLVVAWGVSFAYKWIFYRSLDAGESAPAESKSNCAACGARVRVAADVCRYCGEPIERGDEPR